MATINKQRLQEVNTLLKSKGLLNIIDQYLSDNEFKDFKVEHVKISLKNLHYALDTKLKCPHGTKPVEYCTRSGKCSWVCE